MTKTTVCSRVESQVDNSLSLRAWVTIHLRKFGQKIRGVWKGQKCVVSEKNECKRSQICKGGQNAI